MVADTAPRCPLPQPSASRLRFSRTFATVFAKDSAEAGGDDPKVVKPPSEEGESELDACMSNALSFERHVRDDNVRSASCRAASAAWRGAHRPRRPQVIDAELPRMMAGWCHSILVSRKDMLPEGVTNSIVRPAPTPTPSPPAAALR